MRDITPAYAFNIPSISDGLALDCHLFIPQSFETAIDPNEKLKWPKKGAIVAHPYAPLGGTQEDPVVMIAVEQLLDMDFVVGTFNFRGAQGSQGSTSWTARPERQDYISFAGFMIHFINQLNTSCAIRGSEQQHSEPISLILGGYSYGSLIVSHLPYINTLLHILTEPAHKIHTTEIILRARTLSTQLNEKLSDLASRGREARPSTNPSPGHKRLSSHGSITLGGQETTPAPAPRKASDDSARRSIDIPGRIKDRMIQRHSSGKIRRRSSSSGVSRDADAQAQKTVLLTEAMAPELPKVNACYLLISPLLPPLSGFLSPSLSALIYKTPEPEILLHNPTLVVFGGEDGFTSAKRMRAWCRKMESLSKAFSWHEQERAGHFWREGFVVDGLTGAIERWVGNLELG